MDKDKEEGGPSALQCNLFGAPDPLMPQSVHRHGIESFLGNELKQGLRETARRMELPMSRVVRAAIRFVISDVDLDRPIGSSREFRTRIIATDNQPLRPRGNPSKGGKTAGANRKKAEIDNPQPE